MDIILPLPCDMHSGRIVDATGREIAFLSAETDDEVALELLRLINRPALTND